MLDEKLHPLVQELQAHKRSFQERARVAVADEFQALFAQFPEVGTVAWTQYTPYFNDGDACTFGVNELHFLPANHEDEEDYDSLYERCMINKIRDVTSSWSNPQRDMTEREMALIQTHRSLSGLIHGLKDLMKDIFGDHVVVRATRDGIDVSEFDHD